jgi:hypothetical protein
MLNIQPAQGDNFIRCLPELEREIGEKPAKLLLQLEFWIRTSTTDEIEGKRWTYQSTRDIREKAFPSWGVATINRTINRLKELGLIEIGNHNKLKYDRTRWFALDAEGMKTLKSVVLLEDGTGSAQNGTGSNHFGTRSNQNGTGSAQNGTTIPETPTEITTETPTEKTPAAAEAAGAAAIQTPAPFKTALSDILKTPVMSSVEVGADVIPESPTDDAAHTPSPSVPPVSPSPSQDDELRTFFNGSTAAEVAAMVKQYGRERIMAVIDEVRRDTSARVPPALVIHKLRSGARAAWTWPNTRRDGQSYISGKYAAFIEH